MKSSTTIYEKSVSNIYEKSVSDTLPLIQMVVLKIWPFVRLRPEILLIVDSNLFSSHKTQTGVLIYSPWAADPSHRPADSRRYKLADFSCLSLVM